MSRVIRTFRNRLGTLGYRTKLIIFTFLFALALFSAFLQLTYGYMRVRSILSGAPDCEDYDIVDLAFHNAPYQNMGFHGDERAEYLGKFKTRGFLYVELHRGMGVVFLVSPAFPQARMAFPMGLNNSMSYLPANGSFVEIRGNLYQITVGGKSGVYGSIRSWKQCSIAYEVLVDLLTFGEISGTLVLLVWSCRVIGSSIASRSYMRRELGREAF